VSNDQYARRDARTSVTAIRPDVDHNHRRGWVGFGEQTRVYSGERQSLVYPQLQRGRRLAFPSTSPIDFDAREAHASIHRIVGLQPRAVALTHFGLFEDVTVIAEQLHRWVENCQAAVDDCVRSGEVDCEARLKLVVTSELERSASEAGLTFTADDWKLLAVDLDLNAQGLAYVVSRRLKPVT
jgi:hypothetical protein